MRNFLYDYALKSGLAGIYDEAVTIHPYTQMGVLKLRGKEVGFLLGYSPDNVSVKDIRETQNSRRQSIALMYTALSSIEIKDVYLPDIYHPHALDIYGTLRFKRNILRSVKTVQDMGGN